MAAPGLVDPEHLQASAFARQLARFARRALVNGAPGLVASSHGRVLSILAFTVHKGRITEIQICADHNRLAQHNLLPERVT